MAEEKVRVCEICGRRFEGKYAGRAWAGHMWLAHFKRVGLRGKIRELEAHVAYLRRENEVLKERVKELEEERAKKAELEDRLRKVEEENTQLKAQLDEFVRKAKRLREVKCPYCEGKLVLWWDPERNLEAVVKESWRIWRLVEE